METNMENLQGNINMKTPVTREDILAQAKSAYAVTGKMTTEALKTTS